MGKAVLLVSEGTRLRLYIFTGGHGNLPYFLISYTVGKSLFDKDRFMRFLPSV